MVKRHKNIIDMHIHSSKAEVSGPRRHAEASEKKERLDNYVMIK
jgi:hypothetical protein